MGGKERENAGVPFVTPEPGVPRTEDNKCLLISLSSMQMSLLCFLSPKLARLWCPVWLGRNLFQRSCLDKLMNSFTWLLTRTC